jgi:hypothetical protein
MKDSRSLAAVGSVDERLHRVRRRSAGIAMLAQDRSGALHASHRLCGTAKDESASRLSSRRRDSREPSVHHLVEQEVASIGSSRLARGRYWPRPGKA